MITPTLLRRAAITTAFGLVALTAFSQQPPAPAPAADPAAPPAAGGGGRGGGRGGRGGGGGGAPAAPAVQMSLAQRSAAGLINDNAMALQEKATAAATALVQATFALPKNQSLIDRRAKELADADLALANSRATSLQKIQSSPDKLNAEQLAAVSRGGRGGVPAQYGDYSGFTALFDGKTLNGWDGEAGIFEAVDGTIHMNTAKPGSNGQHHLHYVGGPGLPNKVQGDFDLKVEFKQSLNGNGGIQYRSRLLAAAHSPDGKARGVYDAKAMADPFGKPLPANVHSVADLTAAMPNLVTGNPWQVSGYQLDIVAPPGGGLGQFYEGQGSRFILTSPGNIVQTFPGNVVAVLGTIQAPGEDNPSAKFAKPGDWNQLEIIARGHTFIHLLNGHIMTITVDDDPVRWAKSGMISLQCEGGEIWYRNVYLKPL